MLRMSSVQLGFEISKWCQECIDEGIRWGFRGFVFVMTWTSSAFLCYFDRDWLRKAVFELPPSSSINAVFTVFPALSHDKFFRSSYYWKEWCSGKRSQRWKQLLPPFGRFRTTTPVLIHIWLATIEQCLKKHTRGAFFVLEAICQISRSHRPKIDEFTCIEL